MSIGCAETQASQTLIFTPKVPLGDLLRLNTMLINS